MSNSFRKYAIAGLALTASALLLSPYARSWAGQTRDGGGVSGAAPAAAARATLGFAEVEPASPTLVTTSLSAPTARATLGFQEDEPGVPAGSAAIKFAEAEPTTLAPPAASVGSMESCSGPSCSFGCEPAGCPGVPHIWVRAEYLAWWLSGNRLPPLVTTSPPGTPQSQAGVLGAPGTTVLFGDSHPNTDERSGGSITVGAWLGCDQCLGIECSFFGLPGRSTNFTACSTGTPILARPFFDVTTGKESSELVAFPGIVTGSIGVSDVSREFWGADLLFRKHLCCGCCYYVDALAGYRYLYYSQRIDIAEELTSIRPSTVPPFIPQGTTIAVTDQFATRNSFNGFDMGLEGEVRRGRWSLDWLAKIALGDTFTTLDIAGQTTVTVPGFPPVTNPGGLLALSSNSGHFSRDTFSVVPELGIRLGYDVTPHIRTTLGYTVLWWTGIGDAASAINLNVNPRLLPPVTGPVGGPAAPALSFGRSTLVGQGIDVGIEFRF